MRPTSGGGGQTDKLVQFLARGPGYGLFLTPTGAVLSLHKSAPPETKLGKPSGQASPIPKQKPPKKAAQNSQEKATTLRMTLVGGNPNPAMKGLDELPGKVNYFRGKDPKQWRTNIPTYAKAKYEKVYPGIDLVYYGNGRQLEYDFIVAPGADPKAIRLNFSGADSVRLDTTGDLLLHTQDGELRLHKPVIYQTVAGKRQNVEGNFVLHKPPLPKGDGKSNSPLPQGEGRGEGKHKDPQIGFQVAAYDAAKTLVIDPVLVYSTYLGGSDFEFFTGIAVDSAGNAYVTGTTQSSDFPKVNAKYPNLWGDQDAFVTKFNASGSKVLYSTYLGGSSYEIGFGIAVDGAGNAYVTGSTGSFDFPTVNAKYPNLRGGTDAFVTKFNANGSQVLYSTYLGGNGYDSGSGIAVDDAGNAYVTGVTEESSDFPAVNAKYPNLGGRHDAFVTKFNATGSQVLYSTYLGGTNSDIGSGIAVDSAGNAYVTGSTGSANFPTVNAKYPNLWGGTDAFVTKFDATGSQVLYSSYLGGSGGESGSGIAVDGAGNAYVTGITGSPDFPKVNAKYPNLRGDADAFVTKLGLAVTNTPEQPVYSPAPSPVVVLRPRPSSCRSPPRLSPCRRTSCC